MDTENHLHVLKAIKDMYNVFDFEPVEARSYTIEEAELSKELHAEFVYGGFKKLGRGMQGVDSG